jgi:nitrogen fixation/metabolism regulation signal transduction histidine kinase
MVRRIVGLVSVAAFVPVLCAGLLAALAVVHNVDERLERTYPAVLQWSGETVLSYLEDSRRAILRAAQHPSLAAGIRATRPTARSADPELLETLQGLLVRNQIFASLVALDGEGEVIGTAGTGAELDALLASLAPKNALDSDLGEFMQASELRKELAATARPEVRLWQGGDLLPVPLASAQVHDSRSRVIGSLHGLMRRDGLAQKLHAGALGGGNLLLVAADRSVVAAARPLGRTAFEKLPEEMVAAWDAEPRVRRTNGSVTASHAVGAHDLRVVIRQPIASAYAPAVTAAGAFAAVGLVVALAFPFIAARSAQRLIRPLRLLYTALRGAARERLPAENLPLHHAVGEAESLFQAFNVMADGVRTRLSEAEKNQRALEDQNQAFVHHHETLQKLSVTDELTKLYNHRYFQDHMGRELKRLSRSGC